MVIDRINELSRRPQYSSLDVEMENRESSDAHSSETRELGKFMEEYYAEVQDIKDNIAQTETKLTELQKLYNQYLSATIAEEQKTLKRRQKMLIDETGRNVQKIQTDLRTMNERTMELEKEEANSPVIRIRKQQHALLTKEFIDTLNTYQDLQQQFKSNYKNRLKRILKIVNSSSGGASGEELDRVVDEMADKSTLNPADLVQQSMDGLTSSQSATLDAYYNEASETHDDLKQIEHSLRQLHSMFMDFAMLVEQQDELLDNIEYNCACTVEYVEKGIKDIKTARKVQKTSRKCLYIIIAVVVIFTVIVAILLAVGVPIALKLTKVF
ncbi:predicted protein [Naegleria gruberi]|uniref:Predicted protein n=1 Tax=Naegleria gruberi TaxID=5762 RepID=D2VR16_NAEGR|nr:uncharacterized protein NAEGRDRAFT_80924 [Naegleria gruberi]EFC40811.1 predicted protein [Naegleria gruberi]|eukprot:XP_002673555.1 predicted protein [Naegleria gruberi strain NEG-M]